MTVRIVAIAMMALLIGCSFNGDDAQPSANTQGPNTLTVNVLQIQSQSNAIETSIFYGKLTPRRESSLGFSRGGTVKSISKRIGDIVESGEQIAEIDQSDLDDQKKQLEQSILAAQQNLSQSAPELQTELRRQVTQLESQLSAIESELTKGIIAAPYSCVIAERNVDEGDLVSPQLPAIKVVENSLPQIQSNLPNNIASVLEIGKLVWVVIGNQSVQARIEAKFPIQSTVGNRTILLQVVGELVDGSWAFGQTVTIRFLLKTENSGYWIPFSALQREADGLWSTFVIEPASPSEPSASTSKHIVGRKTLQLIQIEDDWALVQGDLSDGTQVIVNGTHRVVPSQPVLIQDVSAQFDPPGAGANE